MVTYCGREHQRLAPAFTCRQHMPLDILSNPHENIHKQVGLSSITYSCSKASLRPCSGALAWLGQVSILSDLANLGLKPHVQHAVSLVQDHVGHMGQ